MPLAEFWPDAANFTSRYLDVVSGAKARPGAGKIDDALLALLGRRILHYALDELMEHLLDETTVTDWEEKVARFDVRLQRMGAINLAAIDEFEEEQERKDYLDAQYQDLTEALDTLENAIRKIDRETRSRFKETFENVNKRLQEIFPPAFRWRPSLSGADRRRYVDRGRHCHGATAR